MKSSIQKYLVNLRQPPFSLVDLGALCPCLQAPPRSISAIKIHTILSLRTVIVPFKEGIQQPILPHLQLQPATSTLLLKPSTSTAMPLIMSPCFLDDANNLAQAHLATFAYSASASSKYYFKIIDTHLHQRDRGLRNLDLRAPSFSSPSSKMPSRRP